MNLIALAAVVVLVTAPAHGDEGDVVDKLVRFAFDGCDFLHANIPPGAQPLPADSALAPHFGKVLRVTRKLDRETYSLDVPLFRGWSVTLRRRRLELHVPARVRLTVGDFERRLGPAAPPDVDMAASPGEQGDANKAEPEELVFAATKERPSCWIRVTADSRSDDRARQRVLAFQFTD